MSALNVYVRSDRAWLQTDASLYDQNGSILAFGPKAFAMPNLRAVISVRGVQGAAPALAVSLSWKFASFDEMIAHGSLVVRDVFREYVRIYVPADAVERDIELIVVGWSDRNDRPRAYSLYSDGLAAIAGAEPFIFTPLSEGVEDWMIAPDLDTDGWGRLGKQGIELNENGFTTARFDPVAHGVAYMEEQRQRRIDVGNNKQISIVGGFLLSHEITRDGVSEKVIHRWPDKVGEPIQPEDRPAFENVTPIKMNRKERRAAGKRSIYA